MEINKENLNKMADYLDGGSAGYINMQQFCNCVIGHSIRYIEKKTGSWDYNWVTGASARMFGIEDTRLANPTWTFCFGANWNSDPHMAAVRLRYVALHGSAPSADQWERFRYSEDVWHKYEAEAVEDSELEETVAA